MRLRIERTGTPKDIDEAIDVGGEAVAAMPDDHADRGVTVAHLAAVHLARYEQRGVADDLEQAVMLWRAAVAAAPVGNPNRLGLLAGLCHALRVRFEVNSVWADIVEAVDAGRAAVASETKEDLPRGVALVNLASALMARFMFRGSSDDMEEAITACRDALSTVPDDSLNRPILLSVLGGALARRFTLTHERGFVTGLSELAEALAACREAVAVTAPDDPRRSAFLTQLGFVLQIWSSRGEAVGTSDLDEAIDVCREAVAGVATNHPMRAHLLTNLAESLRDRFMKTDVGADLVEAAEVGAEGVALLGADNPTRTDALITYGDVLRRLWVYTDNPEYAVSSMTVCREAATLPAGRVRMRIGAAYDWGRVAAALEKWESAAEAYAKAVELRPMMAWRGLNRADRERLLDLAPELGGNAAACAIAAGEPDRAMELLEWARGVLWSQMMDTRSDLTALRDAAPDLAAEMATVQAELDGQVGGDPQELGHQWDELLDRIRALPGFESFLLQSLAKDLRVAAADGPVVIVNVSEWRCDALVVTTTETHVVSLPELTYDEAWDRTRHYFAAAEYLDQALHSPAALDRSNMAIADTMDWLWETITKPVLGFLGYVETPSQGRPWPRLWWCPCGPLALLPIHAAAGSDGHGVLDRVVSSYTPTLRALIGARLAEFGADTSSLLVVAMPETPGHAALPFVGAERDTLVGAFPGACTLLEGHGATRCAVHDELAIHRWVHFSCHGFQDLHNPSDAGLIVHDGAISLADLTAGDRQSGEWVFLSACKTATGGFKNTDEVITLASALVYSGWRHVIGTLWTVMDSTAAKIAGEVYRSVAADGLLQSDRAAVALHDAVRKVRAAEQDQPGLWAPFVHIGP
ncbi:MAG: CHAT domain-containing protein [Actinobacteria bacterium]|nr:CHAT domain-containing protein [Actinomycetota bacterium]